MADKNKSGAATKPATNKPAATTPAAAPAAAANEDGKKRNFLSAEKALAIALAGLVGILNSEKVAALLTEDQKEQVKNASTMADELNSKTIKPVQERLKVVQAELADFTKDPAKLADPEVIKKVQAHANELSRLQKRLETFTGAATQTI